VVRTPKTLLALPELRCTSHPRLAFADPRLPAGLVSDGRRDLDLEHKLVQRFVHIGGADTDEAVERAIGTVPEELRITNEELLAGVTGKALEVVAICAAKHVGPPPRGAQGAGGKTIVYSLYNHELYITITQLNVSGGPPLPFPRRAFCQRSTRVSAEADAAGCRSPAGPTRGRRSAATGRTSRTTCSGTPASWSTPRRSGRTGRQTCGWMRRRRSTPRRGAGRSGRQLRR
jgi:hypothetical protein